MKRIILTTSFILYYFFVFAQQPGTLRFQSQVFSNYDSVMNLTYGSNIPANQTTAIDLKLDIYLPSGDSSITRPVIFFTHGGSFIGGSRTTKDVVYLCKEFAKRGYVTVSQSYRLGFDNLNFNTINATRAVWRSMQDGRAAVRFMKSQASVYKLDTNKFIYGGSSAGAFVGLHLAYLNTQAEIPVLLDTSEYSASNLNGVGGLKGSTNNLTNTSTVAAIVNLCGALADTAMISEDDALLPIVSLHGTQDNIVPFATNTINIFGQPLLPVNGSWTITKKIRLMNGTSNMFTFCEASHVPYYDYNSPNGALYMDTTVNFISSFLYEKVLNLGLAQIQIAEKDSSSCITSGLAYNELDGLLIYPNPSNGMLNIKTDLNDIINLQLTSMLGKIIINKTVAGNEIIEINISDLSAGIYILTLKNKKATSIRKIFKN